MPVRIIPLKNSSDYLKVSKKGGYKAAPGFVLQFLKNPELPEGSVRVGFTVSRKVGIAVERNRVKRRLRQVVAKVIPDEAKAGFDYVVIGRRAALTLNFEHLVKDLARVLKIVS